jgi:hypothetical protein
MYVDTKKEQCKLGAKEIATNAIREMKETAEPIIGELKKEMNIIDFISGLTPEQLKLIQTGIKLVKQSEEAAINIYADLYWKSKAIDDMYKTVDKLQIQNESLSKEVAALAQQNTKLMDQNREILSILRATKAD